MAHKVFICHSSKDKAVADAACAALEAHRIPCWIAPRDILAGDEYAASIIDALDETQVVLLIFSAHANDSTQVRREIERAVSKEKILVPFRIEDVMPSRAMEFHLMNTHWLDALTPPMEARLIDLCNTIARILERSAASAPLWQQASATDALQRATREAEENRQKEEVDREERQESERQARATTAQANLEADRKVRQEAARSANEAEEKPKIMTMPDIGHKLDMLDHSSAKRPAWRWPTTIAGALIALGLAVAIFETMSPSSSLAIARDRKACDGGNPASCDILGYMYDMGTHLAQDRVKAAALYSKACSAGDAMGCSHLAGVTDDETVADSLYRKACDEGDSSGCYNLAVAYRIARGVPRDLTESDALYRKACDLGFAQSCSDLKALQH